MAFRPVLVTTSPTQLAPYHKRRKTLVLVNNGSVTLFISNDQADMLTRGFPIAAGASAELAAVDGDEPELELFGIVASGTCDVRIAEGTRLVAAEESP